MTTEPSEVSVGLERDAHAELHVGGLELQRRAGHAEVNAGQGLDRAAGRDTAHGDAELGQERFTGNGELQLILPSRDRCTWCC